MRSNSISSLVFGQMLQEQVVERLCIPVLVVKEQLEEAGKTWADGGEWPEKPLLPQQEQHRSHGLPVVTTAEPHERSFGCSFVTVQRKEWISSVGRQTFFVVCATSLRKWGGEKWSMQQFGMNTNIKLHPAVFLFLTHYLLHIQMIMHNKQHTNEILLPWASLTVMRLIFDTTRLTDSSMFMENLCLNNCPYGNEQRSCFAS